MATRKQRIDFIQHVINGGTTTDEPRFEDSIVGRAMDDARAVLLYNQLNKDNFLSDLNFQRICMPLQEGDYADCPNCNVPDIECPLFVGVGEVPQTIRGKAGLAYRIRHIDGTLIPAMTFTNRKYIQYARSKTEEAYGYFLSDRKIFIINRSFELPLIIVEGVFENPQEVARLDLCEDTDSTVPCIDPNSQITYPIDSNLNYALNQMVLEKLGFSTKQALDMLSNSAPPQVVQAQQ